ncbi:hypothetical protein ABZ471_25255 [Streptomyces sp. NPDC005728]|uniref:hypothetical protein n=1 Tax=Streptomyces sp. NPDC005728 TaxID=3157054 RepID=UPI0033F7EADA
MKAAEGAATAGGEVPWTVHANAGSARTSPATCPTRSAHSCSSQSPPANIGDRDAVGLPTRLRRLHHDITFLWANGGYTGPLVDWPRCLRPSCHLCR